MRLLNSKNVDYVITGGIAFSIHARARYTADLDLVVYPSKSNLTLFIQAFKEFGFQLKDNSAEQFLDGRKLIRVGVEPMMIDVMNFFDGVALDELFQDSVCIALDEVALQLVSRKHLIANKRAIGRPRDLADVEELLRTAPEEETKANKDRS